MLLRNRWVSKTISSKKGKKSFKSTVLCVAFHPENSQILACGSADFKCSVFSVFSSDVDSAPDGGPFGAPVEFGDSYAEFSALGWVNAVAWSPSGAVLAFAGNRYLSFTFFEVTFFQDMTQAFILLPLARPGRYAEPRASR